MVEGHLVPRDSMARALTRPLGKRSKHSFQDPAGCEFLVVVRCRGELAPPRPSRVEEEMGSKQERPAEDEAASEVDMTIM